MVRGFVALRMPYTWGLTLALALRYLPILAGLFEQVREAQKRAAWIWDSSASWNGCRHTGQCRSRC